MNSAVTAALGTTATGGVQTGSFSPPSVTLAPNGTGSSTLTVTVRRTGTTGTFTLTVTGTSGTKSHSQNVTLIVTH